MASFTATAAVSRRWVGGNHTQPPLSSSQSSDLSYCCSLPMTSRVQRKLNVSSALHTPPALHFPKQSSNSPAIVFNPKAKDSDAKQMNLFLRAAAAALDASEGFLVSHQRQHPLPKTADLSVQIAGNFTPVNKQPVRRNLPVVGKIPDSIKGVYVRNGDNPLHEPVTGHHFFDGDEMVHAVKFEDDSASYACWFIQTHRFVQEREFGRPVFPIAIGELHGHTGGARLMLFYARAVAGLVDLAHGTGVANADLVYFNSLLLAMSEDDLPYQVRITPVGWFNFDGQLESTLIAHRRVDPESGELFALSYDVVSKAYLKYFRFSPDGTTSPDVEIQLDQPTIMHDFAITETFVVIPDQQVVFKLPEMIRGGSPVVYDNNQKYGYSDVSNRVGVDKESKRMLRKFRPAKSSEYSTRPLYFLFCLTMMAFLNNVTCVISHGPPPMVFLSFRGDELRYNFVSHLIDAFERDKINVFVDKYEQRGKDLKNLFERIHDSRIALAIFSTRYTESSWCMDELVKMKKLVDQGKLRVIPIFYKVEAEDVKKPKGDSEFGKNFWRLAEDSSGDQIKKWKEALECISNKMGLSLREKSSEADFVKEIVKAVQRVIAAIRLEEDQKDWPYLFQEEQVVI